MAIHLTGMYLAAIVIPHLSPQMFHAFGTIRDAFP